MFQNSKLFETKWLKLSFTTHNGLKVFEADIDCPICFKNIKVQNREKEPGRAPKWDLFAINRHISTVHKVQEVETMASSNLENTLSKCN